MLRREKNVAPLSVVPTDRIRAIAATAAPPAYRSVGGIAKRAVRVTLSRQCILETSDGGKLPALLRNVSHNGCRIEYASHAQPSGRVLIRDPNLSLELWGHVVWQAEGACGLLIDDADQLQSLMPELPGAPLISPLTASAKAGQKRSKIRKRM